MLVKCSPIAPAIYHEAHGGPPPPFPPLVFNGDVTIGGRAPSRYTISENW